MSSGVHGQSYIDAEPCSSLASDEPDIGARMEFVAKLYWLLLLGLWLAVRVPFPSAGDGELQWQGLVQRNIRPGGFAAGGGGKLRDKKGICLR